MQKLMGTGEAMCSTSERERHIPHRASGLEKQVSELEECFGNLQGRLQSVRSEDVTANKCADKCLEQPQEQGLTCQLAEHLRQQTLRIRNVCDRINYQLSVLEV